MTSQNIPGLPPQELEGRSVRDVVEYSPGDVDDAWCRKVLRKVLQSLELQYAMQMPHRAITPDTIVFHANGEPLLISDDIDAAPAPDAHQADDLTALAGVIHYAITQELVPTGPLAGRVDGYSAAMVATVDACMDPDPAQRPRTIEAARGLLDMATPVAPVAVAGVIKLPEAPMAPDPAVTATVVDGHAASVHRDRRWAFAAGGAVIAVALAFLWLTDWRDAGSHQQAVLAPPPSVASAQPGVLATGGGASGGTTQSGGGVDQPVDVPDAAITANSVATTAPPAVPAPVAAVARANRKAASEARTGAPARAGSGTASYQLQIKPWGNVYVDGVDRGVSPPLKRLALTPGPHTVRITHPKYRDSILEFDSALTTSNGKIVVEFDRESQ